MSKTKMQASQKEQLAASRFEHGKALLIRGLRAPSFFKRYSAESDPQTGMGGMEVCMPVQ